MTQAKMAKEISSYLTISSFGSMGSKLMEVLIREYSSPDLSQVRDLILNAENFGKPFLENEMLNIKKNTSLGLGRIFVAVTNGKVVGYISLGRRIFALMIDSIIVASNHQRKSVGRKLVEKAKGYARSQGLKVLRTDTGTFMDYAIKFYLACGFEPCGYVENDFSLGSKQLHFFIDLTKSSSSSNPAKNAASHDQG
jgi:ribosomal protein S18 acetylase RimI-like enzyme